MCKEKQKQEEQESNVINSNMILLSFEGWIKFITGFIRGIQSTPTVNSSVVMDCVGEVLEYMVKTKKDITKVLEYCETVLEDNEKLQQENTELRQSLEQLEEEVDAIYQRQND